MVTHHIRAIRHALRSHPVVANVTAKLPPKEHVRHWGKVALRLSIVIALIHLGVKELEHWGVFLKFGHTSEFVTGSIVDYCFVSTIEAS